MDRRHFIGTGAALAVSSALRVPPARADAVQRVRPGMPGWPLETEWAALNDATNGRLSLPVAVNPADAQKLLSNPFFIADQVALTQSAGWLDAWRSSPSAYVVTAENASDVAAAIRCASTHNLRLVVRGGGHSYLGTSNAPDSLLIWTRKMDAVTVHDAFVPAGSRASPVPAVSLGAGCKWLHAYQAVTGGAGRYVQGGGCTTVGVAGLLLGGGFGSFSKATAWPLQASSKPRSSPPTASSASSTKRRMQTSFGRSRAGVAAPLASSRASPSPRTRFPTNSAR